MICPLGCCLWMSTAGSKTFGKALLPEWYSMLSRHGGRLDRDRGDGRVLLVGLVAVAIRPKAVRLRVLSS